MRRMDWTFFDFALAAALLGVAGLLLYGLASRRAPSIAYQAAASGLGVLAIVVGEMDDAPGLVLFGCLLIVATIALAFRAIQRSR